MRTSLSRLMISVSQRGWRLKPGGGGIPLWMLGTRPPPSRSGMLQSRAAGAHRRTRVQERAHNRGQAWHVVLLCCIEHQLDGVP